MKVSQIAQGGGAPAGSEVENGRSAGPDRIARAKSIMKGEPIRDQSDAAPADKQVERAQNSIRRIKMNTQRSTNRHDVVQEMAVPDTEDAQSDILGISEQAQTVIEDTKPLSPQFAALAKAKRALQEERAAFEASKKDQTQLPGVNLDEYVSKSDLKANPLGVIQREGVTYDQLTEAILAQSNEQSPALSRLEAEIKALKEGLENQTKSQTQRDQDAEKQVLSQIARDVTQLVAQGDEFETVREDSLQPKVVELIHRTWKQSGEVLDVDEAARLIEAQAFEDNVNKFTRMKKVQSKLTPAPIPQTAQPQNSNVRVMRTLTNRDGASVPSTARERAIAAFHGRK